MDDDDAKLAEFADELAAAVEAALPGWVGRSVEERLSQAGRSPTPQIEASIERASRDAVAAVMGDLRALLAADVDRQWTGPLALIRRAVAFPTAVLAEAEVPEVARDDAAEAMFPDDRYNLVPASFAPLGPEVSEAGLRWGAAKAHVVLARRRAEGRR